MMPSSTSFRLSWVLANAIGMAASWTASVVAYEYISKATLDSGANWIFDLVGGGAVVGPPIAIAQWITLNRFVRRASFYLWLITASLILGFYAGLIIGFCMGTYVALIEASIIGLINQEAGMNSFPLIFGAVTASGAGCGAGLALGIIYSLLLQQAKGKGNLVFMNSLGGALGGLAIWMAVLAQALMLSFVRGLPFSLMVFGETAGPIAMLVAGAIGGITYGAITCVAMNNTIEQSRSVLG